MMNIVSGDSQTPILLLHGGAGPMDPSSEGMRRASKALQDIGKKALADGPHEAGERVVYCLEALEDDPLFNAGYGSALQADGKARLTAALMDGLRQSFSGVISVTDVRHPSRLAWNLQNASARVLTAPGHELLARRLQLPVENIVSKQRFEAWQKRVRDVFFSNDTVGVIWCANRQLFAGTSTGGRGFEEPGRVSDSATVAGTYASAHAAISATGIGEEIVDDALAARIETRVRDGLSLREACERSYREAIAHGRSYGWIASDANGSWCVAYTTAAMSYVVLNAEGQILASS